MNPASTMKIATTLVALDVLTPSYTWATSFSTTSRIEAGVLQGPLYLRGSGDPKFVADHLQAAVKSLRDRGIREIAGDILLDRTRFAAAAYDPAQFDSQPLRPYNVGPDALLVSFKAVRFVFAPNAARTAAR